MKDFNRKTTLAHDLERLALGPGTRPEYQGVLAALADSDPAAAHALVTDLLSIAGISAVGGRSVGEIADRFLEQAALGAATLAARDAHPDRALSGDRPATRRRPPRRCARWRTTPASRSIRRSTCSRNAPASSPARRSTCARITFSTAFGRGFDYYTGFVFELHDRAGRGDGPLVAGGRYDGLLARLGSRRRSRRSALRSGSNGSPRREARMSALVIAVPSKGRLQENAEAFFARAGLTLVQPRGARDYRGTIEGYRRASRSPISRPPRSPSSSRQGAVHLGVTGEDLVREMIPEADARWC